MIGELIHIENNDVAQIDKRINAVPEFDAVVKMTKGKKLMFYVYAVTDYYSPYARHANIADRMTLAAIDILNGKPPKDKKVLAAISKYKELQYMPMFDQYEVLKRKAKELAIELEQMPMKKKVVRKFKDEDGNQQTEEIEESNMESIMKLTDQYNKFSMNLTKLQEQIAKHIEENGRQTPIVKNISMYEEALREEQLARLQ